MSVPLIDLLYQAFNSPHGVCVTTSDPDWLGWTQYFNRKGHDCSPSKGHLRFGNYVQAVQAALAGEGIMLGWRSVVGDLLRSQQLTIAFNAPEHLESGYYFKTAGQRNQSILTRRRKRFELF